MTWREKLVARLILLLAQMVCDDPALRQELRNVGNHIGLHAPEGDDRG